MNRMSGIDWIILGVMVGLVITAIFRPYDSTDNVETETRSSMYLYIDHATGCHYIKASWFAELTPRVYADGRQVCVGYKWEPKE